MKKEKITNIIFILILMVAFLIIPVKVFASSFKVPFNRADGYVNGRAIFGIYKAIYVTEKENPSNKWLNAKSAYIGGEPDSNGNEVDWVWEGEWGTTVQEYKDAGISTDANGVYKLVNSKYAACVGHNDSDVGSGNDKIVRAININTPYANTVGYKYSTSHDLVSLLNECDLVITTKLHVGILSASLGKSVLAFPTHREKVERYYKQIGESGRCLSLKKVNYDIVFNMLENYHDKKIVLSNEILKKAMKNLEYISLSNEKKGDNCEKKSYN